MDLADIGIFDVAISGGEPLIRRDLIEIMEFALGVGIRLGLGSNGTMLNAQITKELKRIGIDRLQISIDGLEETHDKARRWKGLFRKSINAIQFGLHEGITTHVCFTAHRMNMDEIPEVIDFCASLGVSRFNFSRLVPTGRATSNLDLTPIEWQKVNTVFERKRSQYKGRMEFTTHLAQQILSNPNLESMCGFIGCQAGIGQGCIDSVGNVSPCVMLPICIGNIREKSFEDIWTSSPVIKKLQDRQNLKGRCFHCSYREKCGGCRGVAYSYTGDFLDQDPRCWLDAVSPTTNKNQLYQICSTD
jgi:radical SAM protein with 4Fe4S-binding SPASM domain